jgi:hypothetical protein
MLSKSPLAKKQPQPLEPPLTRSSSGKSLTKNATTLSSHETELLNQLLSNTVDVSSFRESKVAFLTSYEKGSSLHLPLKN